MRLVFLPRCPERVAYVSLAPSAQAMAADANLDYPPTLDLLGRACF